MERRQEVRNGLKDGIAIGMGYFSVSFAFGMQAVSVGISPWIAALMSLTNMTSAGQFASLPLIVQNGSLIELALTQLVINLRYALMSLSLSQKLDHEVTIKDRLIIAFANTDEIFASASARPGKNTKYYQYALMVLPIIMWTLGTLCGGFINTLLPESLRSALGIAIYGMFLAIFIPPAKKRQEVRMVVLFAVLLSCLFHWMPGLDQISSGFVIIICTLLAAGMGACLFPIKEEC